MSAKIIEKTYRGKIRNWQLHNLTYPEGAIELLQRQIGVESILPIRLTGTVDSDPTGRFEVGTHIRTSLLTHYDTESGYCETLNSVYELLGEGESDVIPDLGNLVLLLDYL